MMSSNHSHDRGVEALSALFDGELQGDAARFAMKRLAHDPNWQRSFGNWQLLGDALRGQRGSVAPGDFAARVSAAVAAESMPGAPAPTIALAVAPVAVAAPASPVARRRWIGGAALAASVAMVAMLVARPFSPDGGKAMPAPAAPTELASVSPPATATASRQAQAVAEAALPAGAAAVIAIAEVPRRASDRRSRGQSQRAALRASNRLATTATIARAGAVTEPAPRMGGDPFGPPQVEIASRPWPRAVLPGAGAGAFTAGFHGVAASSPSFYPFEPRLPNRGEVAPMPAGGDDRRR